MFDTSNAILLGKDIYLYKNFLSEKELEEYNNEILKLSENDWVQGDWSLDPEINWMWYSKPVEKLLVLREKISSLLYDDLFLGEAKWFIRMLKNATWGEHSDSYDFKDIIEKSKNYIEGQPFVEESVPFWGLIVYFNNFKGGEIYYPFQKIEYHPKAGDLIIHNADETCSHLVKIVKSDVRYSFSANLRKIVKVPI